MNVEEEKVKMQLWVLRLMSVTLSTVLLSTVVVMLSGLFNPVVDNNEIFKIIGPAFSMVVGAFVGSFATMMGMRTEAFNPNPAKPPKADVAVKDVNE